MKQLNPVNTTDDDFAAKPRCHWCNLHNPPYVTYHDKEWGVPVHDDCKLFEMLLLEGFQCSVLGSTQTK